MHKNVAVRNSEFHCRVLSLCSLLLDSVHKSPEPGRYTLSRGCWSALTHRPQRASKSF